jgi:hypothetical protein
MAIDPQVGEIVAHSYNYKFLLTYPFRHAIISMMFTSDAAICIAPQRPAHNQLSAAEKAATGFR